MKKIFALIFVLMFCTIGFSNSSEALRNLQGLVSSTMNRPQFQNFKMIGQPKTWVTQKGQFTEFPVNLRVGQRYVFMASGDNNSFDIDMYVLDPQGKVVGFDQVTPQYRGGPGSDCGVFIQPMVSGRYIVKVELFDAQPGVSVTLAKAYGTF